MSALSKPVHDAVMALQSAANAALALEHAANTLIEVIQSVAELDTRVQTLERAIVAVEDVEGLIERRGPGSRLSEFAQVRSHVDTNKAAVLLGRAPQTLRKWACYEDGPLRPLRVNGRLAWAVADILRLLGDGR